MTPPSNNALMIIDPQKSIEDAKNRRDIVVTMRDRSILRDGVDFGVVPGSSKPTLLKPGAERLCAAFGFNPKFEVLDKIEQWNAETPLFFYQIVCHLIHIDSGMEVATGVGSCNSMESKYRWRWVDEADVPPHLDKAMLVSRSSNVSEFDFAIDKAETTGQYGKPAAYWQSFKAAMADGTARRIKRKTSKGKELDAWEIGGQSYRIPNDDVFSLVNTIVKMACKRALVAAALIGANASEFFTQDIEDMPGFGIVEEAVVEGTFTEVVTTDQPSAAVRGAGVQPVSQPTSGAVNLTDVLNQALKEKLVKDKARFEDVLSFLREAGIITDSTPPDELLEHIRVYVSEGDLARER